MLSERQRDLLYMYHDFLRGRGMTVCERVPQPVGPARHRAAPPARVQEIVERFERWLDAQGRKEHEQGDEHEHEERMGDESPDERGGER